MSHDAFGNPELWDEYQWEKFLQEQDRKTDKYFELFEKYSEHPNRDELIAREMGWSGEMEEDDESPDSAIEWSGPEAEFFAEDEFEPEDDEEFMDEEDESLLANLEKSEPYIQSMELNRRVYRIVEQNEALRGHPLAVELATRATICSAKMAAALCGGNYSEVGMTIAYLKRSLKAANDCLAACMELREQGLLKSEQAGEFAEILFSIRERLVDLMSEYRVELKRRRGDA